MRYRKLINCVDSTVGYLRQSIEHESHDTLWSIGKREKKKLGSEERSSEDASLSG